MKIDACNVETDRNGRERKPHGTTLFPVACYHDALLTEYVPWHWHDEWEAVYVECGTAEVYAGGRQYRVPGGSGFFLNAGVIHQVLDAGATDCRLRSVLFHPRLVGGSIDSVFSQRYVQPMLADPALVCLCLDAAPWEQAVCRAINEAWAACVQEMPGYEFQVRALLSQVIFQISVHQPVKEKAPTEKELRDSARIKLMLEYVRTHLAQPLTVAAIAKSAAVSESECLRCFRAALGTTPLQYVRQSRIQQAAKLLSSTDQRISAIGAQCGFQEMSYFAKTFRALKGCTPGDYRNARRSAPLKEA